MTFIFFTILFYLLNLFIYSALSISLHLSVTDALFLPWLRTSCFIYPTSAYITANSHDNPRTESIKVPKIYWNFTRKALLTMEWIDGIKLTDAHRINKANLNRKQLIDQVILSILYCHFCLIV